MAVITKSVCHSFAVQLHDGSIICAKFWRIFPYRDRPLLVVFASPAFCTNAVCGPQVEIASELREVYGNEVDFMRVDLYSNPQEIQGDLSIAKLTPLLREWGLSPQEWTFIVDSDGIVTHRFENFAPKPELIEALDQTIAMG